MLTGCRSLAVAQERIQIEAALNTWDGGRVPSELYGFRSSAEAEEAVKCILESVGGLQLDNFVIQASNVPNAAAAIRYGTRLLLYNPSFMQDMQDATGNPWAGISVMAHEIGHHLEAHTITPGGSNPPDELEADEFSGNVLKRLGATLADAQAVFQTFPSYGSVTHPPRDARLTAVANGWDRADAAAENARIRDCYRPGRTDQGGGPRRRTPTTPGTPSPSGRPRGRGGRSAVDCGDDSGRWAHDDACDDNRFIGDDPWYYHWEDGEYNRRDATGTRIQEFEIVRELGFGGFGITYLAHDHALARPVAIKEYFPGDWGTRWADGTISPRSATAKADYAWGLERFVDEARVLARLSHHNIVRVYRIVKAAGSAYMAMEYVDGRSLAEELKSSGPLSEQRVRRMLVALAEGLTEVHAAGLLHRDIKPANVMLRATDDSPVLIDFGAAREQMGRQSRSITSVLTPGYAPIEQYSTKGRQGPWTDLYALGAVAYQALSGRRPDDATERTLNDELAPVETVATSPVGTDRRRSGSTSPRAGAPSIHAIANAAPSSNPVGSRDIPTDKPSANRVASNDESEHFHDQAQTINPGPGGSAGHGPEHRLRRWHRRATATAHARPDHNNDLPRLGDAAIVGGDDPTQCRGARPERPGHGERRGRMDQQRPLGGDHRRIGSGDGGG